MTQGKRILLNKILGITVFVIGAFFLMGGMLVTFAGLTSEKGVNISTFLSTMGIMYILSLAFIIIGIKLINIKLWKLILGIGLIVIGGILSFDLIIINFAKSPITDASMIVSFTIVGGISLLSGIMLIKKYRLEKCK